MKHLLKRIVSFSLSIYIFVVSFFLFPLPTYAKTYYSWDELRKDATTSIFYIASQLKAVANGEFSNFVQGLDAWEQYWNEDNVAVDSETGEVTYSADLVALIKQALEEYAASVLPFKIENTYRLDSIPASTFQSKEAYNTFKTYCASHEIVLTNPYISYFSIGDITPYIKEGGGFVKYSSQFVLYNGNWKLQSIPMDRYTEKGNSDGSYTIELQENYGSTQRIGHYDPDKIKFNEYGQQNFIVTHDGGRIRVFNSASEFMDYNAGQRKIYFGSGFYDKEPGEIKVNYDELVDYMDGKYNQFLEDLKDIIGDNPGISEEDLEKLIDELLGKLGDIGGEIGGNQQETNGILSDIASSLSGIASTLSGYFSSVLSSLDEILLSIKALVWIEADDKLDEEKMDLFDLIDKIWENPEEGSQDAAATLSESFSDIAARLTKKFPFSIPWDIYSLFTVFSGTPPPKEATYRTMTLNAQPFTVDREDLEQDVHDAPYFVLPFVIESYGINEKLILDFKDYGMVSTFARTFLSVLFAVFLIKFTIRIIGLFRGGGGD